MVNTITEGDLLASLERGVLTLLPGTFAARSVRQAFDARQRSAGLKAWESARALAWPEWTSGLWSQLITNGAESRLLLNATQERRLWAEVIAALSPEIMPQERVDSLVRLARSAFRLSGSWELGQRLRSAASTHDSRTFARWAEEFGRRCQEGEYLPAALLERALLSHVERGHLELPNELCLANFPELTPAQERLLAALQRRLGRVERVVLAPPSHPSHPSNGAETGTDASGAASRLLAVIESEREELLSAAHWVRGKVTAAPGLPRPPRVGLLLPERGVDCAELEAVLREVLAPELQPVDTDLSAAPWAFVAGEPLATAPVVSAALDLCRLCLGPLPLEKASALLLSPHLGTAHDREARVHLDAGALRGRTRLRPEIGLPNLAALGERARSGDNGESPAAWLSGLVDRVDKALDRKLRRSYSEWMEVQRQLLKAAGWPGERAQGAQEAAAIRAWDDALDEVATLDFAGERVPFAAAFRAVEQKVAESTLRPHHAGAAVTVLEVGEAVGSNWDALVLLRGTDGNWPAPTRLHPLLGAGLQRDLGMPGTRPEQDREPIEALLASSAAALVTCAAANGDGPLRPSPLWETLGFAKVTAEALASTASSEESVTDDWITEELTPDEAVLPLLPPGEVRGGARVLELQAACGFLAFAEMRLSAAEVDTREAGFDAADAGTILHRALESFWKQVGSQAKLRAMSAEERSGVLRDCVDIAIPAEPNSGSDWDSAYLDLQKQRLRRVLGNWLHHELKREPFTVAESEFGTLIPVGPLQLRVRIDRVDRVEGGVVLVDYKSGSTADPKSWLGERPDQPQLPLYALRQGADEVKAVTFAQVRPGKMRWNGFETEAGVLPREGTAKQTRIDLRLQTEEWRSTLVQLATDFSEGRTEVNPKEYARNCKRCAQRLLCRLDPASLHDSQMIEEDEMIEEIYG